MTYHDITERQQNINVTTYHDVHLDPDVFVVVGIVRLGHAPLVEGEDTARLEYAVDLGEALGYVTGVTRRLDGVGAIEAVVGKRHAAEIFLQLNTAVHS